MAKKSKEELETKYEVEDFFEYILEVYINGNLSHVKELFDEMTISSKRSFISWVCDIEQSSIRKGILTRII